MHKKYNLKNYEIWHFAPQLAVTGLWSIHLSHCLTGGRPALQVFVYSGASLKQSGSTWAPPSSSSDSPKTVKNSSKEIVLISYVIKINMIYDRIILNRFLVVRQLITNQFLEQVVLQERLKWKHSLMSSKLWSFVSLLVVLWWRILVQWSARDWYNPPLISLFSARHGESRGPQTYET